MKFLSEQSCILPSGAKGDWKHHFQSAGKPPWLVWGDHGNTLQCFPSEGLRLCWTLAAALPRFFRANLFCSKSAVLSFGRRPLDWLTPQGILRSARRPVLLMAVTCRHRAPLSSLHWEDGAPARPKQRTLRELDAPMMGRIAKRHS